MDHVKIRIRQEEQTIFSITSRRRRSKMVCSSWRILIFTWSILTPSSVHAKIRRNAAVMDELDVACSFATLAQEQQMVRPILNDQRWFAPLGGF
jgi:DNA mismatch repair ATPase MutS